MQIPPVTDFMDGFVLGVRYYNEKHGTKVEVVGWDPDSKTGLFTDNFDNREVGMEMGKQLMEAGVDIIFPVAGCLGLGTAAAVQERGTAYVIGVDSDWAITSPEYADITLTSVLKKMDATIFAVVKKLVEENFTGGYYVGTLENGGVDIAPFHNLDWMVSESMKAELAEIKIKIITGEIQTSP
jgi:basic membrane protein A